MQILHLSADYPDPLEPRKTRAISNLLALTPELRHRVWSLNRLDGWGGVESLRFDDEAGGDHRAIVYSAPPKGLFLRRFLRRLGDWIAEDAAASGFRPDLVHAHKLTIEGLAAERVAERLGAPLALSIQGNTDLKIVGARPDLRPVYRRLWRDAAVVFPFAPWATTALEARLGSRSRPTRLLPCPTPSDRLIEPRLAGPVIRSAFNLGHWRNKNAQGLMQGIARASRLLPEIRLELIGGGDAAAFRRLSELSCEIGEGRTHLLGARPHDQMQTIFNGSAAFAMPSHRESFGMVYAEALLAGAPCLHSRERGIDGYLDGEDVTVAVDPDDPDAIADGLLRLTLEEAAFKRRLADLSARGALDFLRRETIAETYRGGLRLVGSERLAA